MRMESRLGTKAIRATPMYHCSMSVRLDVASKGWSKTLAYLGLLLIAYTTTSDVSTTADPCRLLLGLAFRDLHHRTAELIGMDGVI